jgi:hypothetical protein
MFKEAWKENIVVWKLLVIKINKDLFNTITVNMGNLFSERFCFSLRRNGQMDSNNIIEIKKSLFLRLKSQDFFF